MGAVRCGMPTASVMGGGLAVQAAGKCLYTMY